MNGNQLEKEKALKELHNSFALLSNKEQKYAKLFLHALENGEVKLEDGKTFKDYITEYEVNDFNNWSWFDILKITIKIMLSSLRI